MTMKLIIGLGNPGKKYEGTRHNVGFDIIDELAKNLECEDWKASEKFFAEISESSNEKEQILLVKPSTYMNHSGKSVSALVNFYKLDPANDILICYDDKDMLFGKLRERREGSSGGHNGIKSITDCIGTDAFHRLKFGVGHEDQNIPTDAFVLQKFTKEEMAELPQLINEAVEKIKDWLKLAVRRDDS